MKNIFKSKTIWIAVTQGVLGIVVAMQGLNPELGYLMIVKSALDVIIRFLTEESVTI